ncbi:GlsB/YeaQ/YmgE family stress response membrane protein [Jatrophihabitans sp.]|uniref:GlsB/YeaQ/YmgE family stress response membrane protein n=1 Tax=Jatrophihabitans sp. TaxID=1932789 RepID=UPI0030C6693F|nr:Transglycosylase associated protein [Jatrophihabitans sp.]
MFYILGLLLVGLLAGAIARLFVGSPERLGCLGTSILGIIGSYAGGSLWAILSHDKFDLRKASTFIGAVIGSIVVLLIWRAFDRAGSRRR